MIPRVSSIEFTEGQYFSRHLPAIVTDGLQDWSDQGRWSPQCLVSKMQDRTVKVCVSKNGNFNWKPTRDFTSATDFLHEEMSLAAAAKFIAEGQHDRHIYLMQQSIPQQFPELMQQLTVPKWIAGHKGVEPHLWFGRDSISQLHFDSVNNFFAQLHGSKQLTLFSPKDTGCLYPFPLDAAMTHFSSVDPDKPDLQQHPKFEQATPLRFTLEAGELLFMPAYWWHGVRANGVAISISFWWSSINLTQYVTAPNALRSLYHAYTSDRLLGVKRALLVPSGLGFLAAAKLLLRHREAWAAAIFALAAFDEFLGQLCSAKAVPRQKGCALRDLPKELGVMSEKLPPGDDVGRALDLARKLALQLAPGDERPVDEGDVDALIKVTLLLERGGLGATRGH